MVAWRYPVIFTAREFTGEWFRYGYLISLKIKFRLLHLHFGIAPKNRKELPCPPSTVNMLRVNPPTRIHFLNQEAI